MVMYSYSRLGTFGACSLQYKFRCVDRIKMDTGPSIKAFLGLRVHDALEWLYDQVRNARAPTEEEVISVYQRGWDAEWTNDVRVIKEGFEAADYRAVGEQCLRAYCTRHAPFDEGIVLSLEEAFRISLDDGSALNGYIDRLMKVDGDVYEVHYYKTSQKLPTPEQAQTDEQAGWYAREDSNLRPAV
jgi:RecB family exonuclease